MTNLETAHFITVHIIFWFITELYSWHVWVEIDMWLILHKATSKVALNPQAVKILLK